MANFHVIAGASDTPAFPTVRRIGPTDLKDALRNGFADFWAMPSQVFFIGLIYPVAGVILAGLAFGQNMLPLLYPLASGFALVGPIVSIGLYELSRRREQGLPTDWKYAFEVLQSPAIGSIAALGVVLLVIFSAGSWPRDLVTRRERRMGIAPDQHHQLSTARAFTLQLGDLHILAREDVARRGFASASRSCLRSL